MRGPDPAVLAHLKAVMAEAAQAAETAPGPIRSRDGHHGRGGSPPEVGDTTTASRGRSSQGQTRPGDHNAPSVQAAGPFDDADHVDERSAADGSGVDERGRAWMIKATSLRPLSEAEAEEKLSAWLVKRELNIQIVPDVLNWARAQGLLDDGRFAQGWVADRGVNRGYGRRRLTQELRRRKIPDHHIEHALTQLDEVDEYAQAKALAGQRFMRYKASEDPRRVANKLAQFLMRRGFDSGLACRVALDITRADHQWD